MKTLNAAGVLLYDERGKVFLTQTKYWEEYLLPGGKEEPGETPEQAVRREAHEELDVEISDLILVRTDYVIPGSDLTPRGDYELATYDYFVFTSFIGKPMNVIQPSPDFRVHNWYAVEETRYLNLAPPVRRVIEFYEHIVLPMIKPTLSPGSQTH